MSAIGLRRDRRPASAAARFQLTRPERPRPEWRRSTIEPSDDLIRISVVQGQSGHEWSRARNARGRSLSSGRTRSARVGSRRELTEVSANGRAVSSTTTIKNDAYTTTTVESSLLSVEISVVTEIDAPADAVWRVLTDTSRFPDWNPFITSFEGTPAVGAGITVVLALSNRKPQTLRPKIIELQEGRSLVWRGHIGVPGILGARHRLEVQEAEDQHSRFVQHERFSGFAVPAVRSVLTVNTPDAFFA